MQRASPNLRRTSRPSRIYLAVLAASLALNACGFGPLLQPTPTATSVPPTATPLPPTVTPTPSPTETATPGPEVKTSQGEVVITQVETTTGSFLGDPGGGDRYLIVWFDGAAGSAVIGGDFFKACRGAYATYEKNSKVSKVPCNIGGMYNTRLFAAFRVPADARDFALVWPNNDPIPLIVRE